MHSDLHTKAETHVVAESAEAVPQEEQGRVREGDDQVSHARIPMQENATPKISATPKHQIQLMKPCFKKGSLASVSEDSLAPHCPRAYLIVLNRSLIKWKARWNLLLLSRSSLPLHATS